MPKITMALQRQLTATPAKVKSSADDETKSIEPSPSIAEDDPVELVYNIRTNKFRTCYRSNLLTQDLKDTPLFELRADMPPLLVDGRMQVVEIPRWKMKVAFLWRKSDGNYTKVNERVVKLPGWLWLSRNFEGKFTELWIENV